MPVLSGAKSPSLTDLRLFSAGPRIGRKRVKTTATHPKPSSVPKNTNFPPANAFSERLSEYSGIPKKVNAQEDLLGSSSLGPFQAPHLVLTKGNSHGQVSEISVQQNKVHKKVTREGREATEAGNLTLSSSCFSVRRQDRTLSDHTKRPGPTQYKSTLLSIVTRKHSPFHKCSNKSIANGVSRWSVTKKDITPVSPHLESSSVNSTFLKLMAQKVRKISTILYLGWETIKRPVTMRSHQSCSIRQEDLILLGKEKEVYEPHNHGVSIHVLGIIGDILDNNSVFSTLAMTESHGGETGTGFGSSGLSISHTLGDLFSIFSADGTLSPQYLTIAYEGVKFDSTQFLPKEKETRCHNASNEEISMPSFQDTISTYIYTADTLVESQAMEYLAPFIPYLGLVFPKKSPPEHPEVEYKPPGARVHTSEECLESQPEVYLRPFIPYWDLMFPN